jgi:hypothetical protein
LKLLGEDVSLSTRSQKRGGKAAEDKFDQTGEKQSYSSFFFVKKDNLNQ